MELICANNLFIIVLLFILIQLYFKTKIFLLLSIILLVIYIFVIIKNEVNSSVLMNPMNIIYNIFLIMVLVYFISKLF
jgi:hypothetical protein